jgi:hypothetical protein
LRARALEEAAEVGSRWSRVAAKIQRIALYEAGTKTWPTRIFLREFAPIDDEVARGILTVQRYGWRRALDPEITFAYLKTIRTGLTPFARNPRVLIPVAAGSIWAGIKIGMKLSHWLDEHDSKKDHR